MSVRNGLPYVKETVASIRRQSFAQFEFVIVDNASTDGSVEFLEQVAREETRVRLLLNERDLGHSGGLNRGLGECRGEWVARIDADDVAMPQRLERQLAFVAAEPRLELTSCLAYYIDPDGRRVGKTYHDLKTAADFDRYMSANEMIGLLHPGAFMRRKLVNQVGGYRSQFAAANDIDLWARIAETGALVLVQQEYLMEYRVHAAQISAGFSAARLKYEFARVCARARRSSKPEPSWEEFLLQWQSAPWPRRLDRWRKTRAKEFYRAGGLRYATGQPLRAAFNLVGATLLQPSYALRRLRGQWSWRGL
jgi:glycosyltransferase involved in cell wall biosynthesis